MNTSEITNLTPDVGERTPTTNPLAENLNITLSIPETIDIKMVDASALTDFEIWFFGSSLLFSVAIGFLVPFVQSVIKKEMDGLLGANAGVFLLLFIGAFCVTIYKRSLLKKKSRKTTLYLTDKIVSK